MLYFSSFQVVFNRAICCAYQQDIRTAVHMLIEAGKVADEELHTRISVQAIQDLTLIKEDGMKVVQGHISTFLSSIDFRSLLQILYII